MVHVVGWLQPIQQPQLTLISCQYQSTAFALNAFAAHDAESLKQLDNVFDTKQTRADSLSSDEIRSVLRQIHGGGVTSWLQNLFGWNASKDVVYVNAIGIALQQNDATGPVPYLVGDEFDPSANDQQAGLVAVEELLDAIAESGAQDKILVLDCQRVGSWMPRGVIENQFVSSVKQLLKQRSDGNLQVLFSTGDHEISQTDPGTAHSVFGRFFLAGVQGDADTIGGNNDGRVTMAEMRSFLQTHVNGWTGQNREQTQTCELHGPVAARQQILSLVSSSNSADTDLDAQTSPDRSADIEQLSAGWTSYYELATSDSHPAHRTPVHWHALELSLLRAEDHFQCGQSELMSKQLAHAKHIAAHLAKAAADGECSESWSLAMNGLFGHAVVEPSLVPAAATARFHQLVMVSNHLYPRNNWLHQLKRPPLLNRKSRGVRSSLHRSAPVR